MPDVKPPRLASDERTTLLALLQYHRESVVKKVAGIGNEVATWSPVESGTSLLGLVQHLASAETLWVVTRFAGEVGAAPPPTETLEQAVDAYRTAWSRVGAIVATDDLEAQCRGLGPDEPPANLRWVLTHLLEETARHAGHADIIRELIDGETGR
jgi:hypothetical protein